MSTKPSQALAQAEQAIRDSVIHILRDRLDLAGSLLEFHLESSCNITHHRDEDPKLTLALALEPLNTFTHDPHGDNTLCTDPVTCGVATIIGIVQDAGAQLLQEETLRQLQEPPWIADLALN